MSSLHRKEMARELRDSIGREITRARGLKVSFRWNQLNGRLLSFSFPWESIEETFPLKLILFTFSSLIDHHQHHNRHQNVSETRGQV